MAAVGRRQSALCELEIAQCLPMPVPSGLILKPRMEHGDPDAGVFCHTRIAELLQAASVGSK